MKKYELLEHTADIRVRMTGKDLKGLFKNSALAMFDIIAQRKLSKTDKQEKIIIEQKADNLDELFINWLNELLSLSSAKELIFSEFQIKKLDENNLEAVAMGENEKKYKVNTEIKAATYHGLKLEKIRSGWQAEVIFDV